MTRRMFVVPSGAEVEVSPDNYIETEVVFDLSAMIDHDLEGFLDLLSLGATDTEILMDIAYQALSVTPQGNIVLKVEGDISMIIDTEDETLIEILKERDDDGNQVVTIKVPAEEFDKLTCWLDSDKQVPDAGRDEVLKTYTADFGGGIEVDIKVCNGDTGPWVDPVLFRDGSEIQVLEPDDSLGGEYPFEGYIVTVERSESNG